MVGTLQSYVIDTNTVIDLYFGNILPHIFQLPCSFFITDFLEAEFILPPFSQLKNLGICVDYLDSEEVTEIISLQEEYDKPSFNDLSVLVLAKRIGTILITGDENLRHAAISKGVSCHGTCWLIDFLTKQGILSCSDAIAAYTRMMKQKRNPPRDECRALSSQWKQRKKLLE
jgi:rRNA-processing protein FCF1